MEQDKAIDVYSNTSFYLITIKDGKLNLRSFYGVGRKCYGIDFINQTRGISKEDYILIGPAAHRHDGDIEPRIITDIEEQRQKVLEHLKNKFSTFDPESVIL